MTSVLHVLPHAGGGAETYRDAVAEAVPGWTHERFELSAGRSPLSLAASLPGRALALRRAARAADALHVHGDASALLVAPLLRGRPSVMTTHGLHLIRRRPALGPPLARALRAATVVVCTSHQEHRELLALGLDPERLVAIHNAVAPVATPDPQARAATRATLGLRDDDVAVLFAGELEERKRPLLAIEACVAAGPPVVALIAGDGAQGAAVRAAAAAAPAGRVRALGFRDDLPALMAAVDLFAAPSDREGLSYALLEALAHGLPVVASDGPGNPEAVGEAGIVVPAGDTAAFADALRTLAADPHRRIELGRAARARAASSFSPEHFAEATRRVYARLG